MDGAGGCRVSCQLRLSRSGRTLFHRKTAVTLQSLPRSSKAYKHRGVTRLYMRPSTLSNCSDLTISLEVYPGYSSARMLRSCSVLFGNEFPLVEPWTAVDNSSAIIAVSEKFLNTTCQKNFIPFPNAFFVMSESPDIRTSGFGSRPPARFSRENQNIDFALGHHSTVRFDDSLDRVVRHCS